MKYVLWRYLRVNRLLNVHRRGIALSNNITPLSLLLFCFFSIFYYLQNSLVYCIYLCLNFLPRIRFFSYFLARAHIQNCWAFWQKSEKSFEGFSQKFAKKIIITLFSFLNLVTSGVLAAFSTFDLYMESKFNLFVLTSIKFRNILIILLLYLQEV